MVGQSVTGPGKKMAAHRTEGIILLVVEIVGDLEPGLVDLDEIERVPFPFASAAMTRRRGP